MRVPENKAEKYRSDPAARTLVRVAGLVIAAHVALGPLSAAAQPGAFPGETRSMLAEEMSTYLSDNLLGAWYPRTIDSQFGGFLSNFNYGWEPGEQQNKMIVTQARHVWTASRAALFLNDPAYLQIAEHGFHFLRDHMWDCEHGGFFWLVERDGTVIPEQSGRIIKQSYGIAFGIYALAAYFEASGDSSARALAIDAFQWLDDHARDPVHGGYFNYLERDGTALRAGHDNTPPKDQNSSIHLLEAFTELYQVWPDPHVGERLYEMLLLIRDTMVVVPGYLQLFFSADWQPVSFRDSSDAVRAANYFFDHISFGHDVETAYLMLEASHVLGLRNDTRTAEIAKQMVDHALLNGWDDDAGGFYDGGYYLSGETDMTILRDTKNWWAQAEGLNTLLLMAERYPHDSLRYQDKFLRLWSYTKEHLIDHEHGGWYEGGLDKEPEVRTGPKAHIWKGNYHNARALMNCVRMLREGG